LPLKLKLLRKQRKAWQRNECRLSIGLFRRRKAGLHFQLCNWPPVE